jgi:hypothetical protein
MIQCGATREHKHLGENYACVPYHTHVHRCRYERKHGGKHKCERCSHQWGRSKKKQG